MEISLQYLVLDINITTERNKVRTSNLPVLQADKWCSYIFYYKLRPKGDDLSYFCSSIELSETWGKCFYEETILFSFLMITKRWSNCFPCFSLQLCKAPTNQVSPGRAKMNADFLYQHWFWWYQVSFSNSLSWSPIAPQHPVEPDHWMFAYCRGK